MSGLCLKYKAHLILLFCLSFFLLLLKVSHYTSALGTGLSGGTAPNLKITTKGSLAIGVNRHPSALPMHLMHSWMNGWGIKKVDGNSLAREDSYSLVILNTRFYYPIIIKERPFVSRLNIIFPTHWFS